MGLPPAAPVGLPQGNFSERPKSRSGVGGQQQQYSQPYQPQDPLAPVGLNGGTNNISTNNNGYGGRSPNNQERTSLTMNSFGGQSWNDSASAQYSAPPPYTIYPNGNFPP